MNVDDPWRAYPFAPDIVSHRHRAEQIETDAEDAAYAACALFDVCTIEDKDVFIDRINQYLDRVLAHTQMLTTFASLHVDETFKTAIRQVDNDYISRQLDQARIWAEQLNTFIATHVEPAYQAWSSTQESSS